MKNIALLIILLIFSLPNFAQVEFPFVKEGAIWSESRFGLGIPQSYYHYGILGDTVIQNTIYKKVFIWQGVTSDINVASKELFGFVREENQMVTITYPSNDMDTLFNSNWMIGDSLGVGGDDTGMLFSSKIRSIDSVLITGDYRKRWNFYGESTTLPADTFPIFSYIDGIGTDRFTFFSAQQPYFDKVFRLLCYQEDDIQIYIDPNSSTCGFITNTHQVKLKDNHLKIYPNPTLDILNIFYKNLNQSNNGVFRLVDLQGRVVLEFDADKNDTTYLVSLEKYASGIYFLHYFQESILMKSEKIIIQK